MKKAFLIFPVCLFVSFVTPLQAQKSTPPAPTAAPVPKAKAKGLVAPKVPEPPKRAWDKMRKLDPSDQDRAEKVRSPREMLKTFYFAVTTYDMAPAMIQDALLCMDLEGKEPPADSVLLALELEQLLRELELPLAGVPDQAQVATEMEVVLHDADGVRVALRHHEDGGWRFDAASVRRAPMMRRALLQKRAAVDKSIYREGFASPRETMRQFLRDALNGDFYAAARALDLTSLSTEQRAERGPVLAQQLAFVIQRRGYIFSQEVPAHPAGTSYTWNADANGRIVLERVRGADGKEAWLFGRRTVSKLGRMYDACREQSADMRYFRLGVLVPSLPAEGTSTMASKRDDSVPAHLGSPRAVLKGFFRAMDGAENNDARLQEALEFLDLRGIDPNDRISLGPKLAAKLEGLLRKVSLDLSAVADAWNAPPFVIGDAQGCRIEVVRQHDGCWRFSEATLVRVQTAVNQGNAKARADRAHQLESARDAVVTLLNAAANDDFAQAAACLDLSWLHPAARDDLGPILAFKLKFALDRLGRLYIQEIPDEPDGERFLAYRGELGRLVIARKNEQPGKGSWLFTADSVRQIEPIFRAVLRQPLDASLEGERGALADAGWWNAPGVWLRLRLPDWLQTPTRLLEPYQIIGLVAAALVSLLSAWLCLAGFYRLVGKTLRWSGSQLSQAFVAAKLRPLTWLMALWLFFQVMIVLDLPLSVLHAVLPCQKFLQAVLIGWLGFRLVDLTTAIYTNSELLRPHRSLSDMVVPVTMRILKTVIVLLVVTYMVFQIGEGELVGSFLTGLGVLGLAASLAAQDALKGFFGTLLLIGERAFKIGDRIVVNGQEGIVEQVGFRTTNLRTPDGTLLTLPNSTLAAAAIDNQGARSFRRIRTTVLVHPDTPLDQVLQLRDRLHGWLRDQPHISQDKLDVHLHQVTDKGIELAVHVMLTSSNKGDENQLRQSFHGEVLRQCAAMGLALAGATKPAPRQQSFSQAA